MLSLGLFSSSALTFLLYQKNRCCWSHLSFKMTMNLTEHILSPRYSGDVMSEDMIHTPPGMQEGSIWSFSISKEIHTLINAQMREEASKGIYFLCQSCNILITLLSCLPYTTKSVPLLLATTLLIVQQWTKK